MTGERDSQKTVRAAGWRFLDDLLRMWPLVLALLLWGSRVELHMADNDYEAHRSQLLAYEIPPPEVQQIGEKVDQLVVDVAVLKTQSEERGKQLANIQTAIDRLLEED